MDLMCKSKYISCWRKSIPQCIRLSNEHVTSIFPIIPTYPFSAIKLHISTSNSQNMDPVHLKIESSKIKRFNVESSTM